MQCQASILICYSSVILMLICSVSMMHLLCPQDFAVSCRDPTSIITLIHLLDHLPETFPIKESFISLRVADHLNFAMTPVAFIHLQLGILPRGTGHPLGSRFSPTRPPGQRCQQFLSWDAERDGHCQSSYFPIHSFSLEGSYRYTSQFPSELAIVHCIMRLMTTSQRKHFSSFLTGYLGPSFPYLALPL